MGLDTAHKLAYEFAVKQKFKYLITMDADLSHDPNELINFIKQIIKKNERRLIITTGLSLPNKMKKIGANIILDIVRILGIFFVNGDI